MGILKEMEKFIKEQEEELEDKTSEDTDSEEEMEEDEKITGFSMEPDGDNYKVMLKGKEIATVEFVNNDSDQADDLEDAQSKPDKYTVYVTDIKDQNLVKEYLKKLDDMGFESVSV